MKYSQGEMFPLDTKQSGGKILPLSDLRRGGSVSGGSTTRQATEKYTIEKKNLPVPKAWLRRDMQLGATVCFLKHRQRVLTYICTLVQKD
jgi:hypothetical protein